MSDLDVSLRLRLVNQISKPAEDAERDLKELRSAADRLGKSTPNNLGRELEKLGISATEAKGKIGAIGTEADELRRRIGRIDDGAFAGLKSDALAAEQAINRVGQAAGELRTKLRGASMPHGPSVPGGVVPGAPYRTTGAVGSAVEGFVDRLGVPVALGAGAAYMAGTIPAAALVAGGAAVNAAAGDEQRSDALRSTGGYSAEEQRRFDQIIGRAGARHGVGTEAAQGVFGALQAGGLSSADAAAMTDSAVKFSVGTKADPTDAANLTIALRSLMGIDVGKMGSAYDAIATGGNNGKFEIKDMARNFPSIFARMAARGSGGMLGVRTATAMSQPIAEVSGSNDEAATAFEAMLDDLGAADVRERAKKYGFDPMTEMDAAKARGEDPVLGVLKRIREVFGNNREAFADVFRNNTAVPAYRAVMDNIDQIDALVSQMESASGVVDQSYEINTDNFNSQKDRLLSIIGKRIKDAASPALPFLTGISKAAADAMEREENARAVKENQEKLFKVLFSELPKADTGGQGGDAPWWQKILFGKAAEPDFDLRKHMGIDLGPQATTAMQGYNQALAAEGEKATQEAQSIAERIKAMLGFTVSPTISPVIVPPSSAPASSGPQPSVQPMTNKTTNYITSPNPQHAALKAGRAQARAIQQAQARSIYDTGRRLV